MSIPSDGGARNGAAFFSAQMALFQHCTHKLNAPEPLTEPLPGPVCTRLDLCHDCPYGDAVCPQFQAARTGRRYRGGRRHPVSVRFHRALYRPSPSF